MNLERKVLLTFFLTFILGHLTFFLTFCLCLPETYTDVHISHAHLYAYMCSITDMHTHAHMPMLRCCCRLPLLAAGWEKCKKIGSPPPVAFSAYATLTFWLTRPWWKKNNGKYAGCTVTVTILRIMIVRSITYNKAGAPH